MLFGTLYTVLDVIKNINAYKFYLQLNNPPNIFL